jgi:hypothetical protein
MLIRLRLSAVTEIENLAMALPFTADRVLLAMPIRR